MDITDIRDIENIVTKLKEQIIAVEGLKANSNIPPYFTDIVFRNIEKAIWFKQFQSECNTLLKTYFGKDSDEFKEFNNIKYYNTIKFSGSGNPIETSQDDRFQTYLRGLDDAKLHLQSCLDQIELKKHTLQEKKNQKETEPYIQFNAYGGNATSNSTVNASSIMNITIDQTINAISEMPVATLSEEEKEKLQNDLYALEGIKTTKDKNKFWEKAKPVLSFLTDKGADALIAAAPYIITTLKNM